MSLRAWIVAFLGISSVCWVVSLAELMYVQSGFLQLPPAALVLLGLLVGYQKVARGGRWGFTTGEIATLYCMFLLSALVASRGLMEKLVSLLVAPNYFVRPTNRWAENYFPFMKPWSVAFDPLGPPNQFVSRAYYEGLRSGQSIPWEQWLRPMAAWAILIGFVFGSFLCLAALLRRPWVDNERLAFPLVQLPQEMIESTEGAPFWRNPLLWAGFAAPAFVYSLNALRSWFPSLPFIPIQYTLNDYFTAAPWNSIFWTPVVLSFAAIGFLYLVPTELLFSLWFFFGLTRLSEGMLAGLGMEMPDMPYFPARMFTGYQVAGAYVVLAFGLLRTAYPYWRDALKGRPLSHPERELLPPRAALIGLGICLVGMGLWSQALGLSFGWAVLQWAIYLFVVCLVMARSVSEGGVLMTETSFRPVDLYALAAPIHTLGRGNMIGMASLDAAWYRDQRGLVLTGLLDALKLGTLQGIKRRTLLPALCAALVLATVASALAQIWLPYHLGALNFYWYLTQGNPVWFYDYYSQHLNGTVPSSWQGPVFFGVGVAVTTALIALQTWFVGWPLLPLGYALSGSWTMIMLWFSCLLVWGLKTGILRYGGRKTFLRLRPLFLGMALGEFSMAVIWTLISAMAGIPAPPFPWP